MAFHLLIGLVGFLFCEVPKSRVHLCIGWFVEALKYILDKSCLSSVCIRNILFSFGKVTFSEQNMLLSKCPNFQTFSLWLVFLVKRSFFIS